VMSSRRSRLIALLGVLLTPGLMACGTVGTPCPSLPETPTTPCGTFTFTGTPEADVRGVDITVAFSFHPPLCSAACNSSANAYVQVIRIIDIDSGAYMQPHSEQQDRIVSAQTSLDLDGWAVDRIANRRFGHYGRNDDGSFVAERVVPGSNIAAATLTDQPVVWPDRASFEAVSVPVSIDGQSACVDRLLGYHYWNFSFAVGQPPVVLGPFGKIGVNWQRDMFDLAVTQWNVQAQQLNRTQFPLMTRLEP